MGSVLIPGAQEREVWAARGPHHGNPEDDKREAQTYKDDEDDETTCDCDVNPHCCELIAKFLRVRVSAASGGAPT